MSNAVNEKSFYFAVQIVNLYRFLCDEKKEYALSKQLIRSGASIGAIIEESMLLVQGKRDFLNKVNLALKEANETYYWIRLLQATGYIDEKTESIASECREMIDILTLAVQTTKVNLEAEKMEKRRRKKEMVNMREAL